MTLFGPDISSYQHGINVRALIDQFVLAKATEGTYYTDADYQGWRTQAASSRKLFVWYHFLSGEDPHAQVQHTIASIGDATLPGMLDFEPTGSFRPTLAQALAYIDAAHAGGLRLRLLYFPRWYWSQIGSPDLSPLTARGIGLVSSAYPGGSGYPGDNAPGWLPYGGVTPLLYQYTDSAIEGGQRVGDMNAYKGTAQQLAAFLGTATPTPAPTTSGGSPVGTIPPSISAKWPELAGDFPANATFTDESALIWGDAGARAAALYARQTLDAVNALAQRIGAPVSVDVAALAAALAPHLEVGASADEVATAVVAHLAAAIQRGGS